MNEASNHIERWPSEVVVAQTTPASPKARKFTNKPESVRLSRNASKSCFVLLVDRVTADKQPGVSTPVSVGCTYNSKHKAYHPYGGKADHSDESFTSVIEREWKEETGLSCLPSGSKKIYTNVQRFNGIPWHQTFMVCSLSETTPDRLAHVIDIVNKYERDLITPVTLECMSVVDSHDYDSLFSLWTDHFSFVSKGGTPATGAMISALCFANLMPK